LSSKFYENIDAGLPMGELIILDLLVSLLGDVKISFGYSIVIKLYSVVFIK